MVKKIRFTLLLLVFVFSLLFLCVVNIDFFLNRPWIKGPLINFLKNTQKIDINYKKIKIDVFEGKVKIEDFVFKNRYREVEAPEVTAFLSLSKIFRLKFFPESIQVKNLKLKSYRSPEPLNLYQLRDQLKKMAPFNLKAKEATIEYESSIGWLIFDKTDLFLKIDNQQTLWELKSLKSPQFKEAEIKGRLNLASLFLETSIEARNFDFTGFIKGGEPFIGRLTSDLMAELTLEKENLYLSFQMLNPQLILKQFPQEKLLGGVITGIFSSQKDGLMLNLKKIVLRNPFLEAQGEFLKKKEGLEASLKVKKLDLAEIKRVGLLLFEKQKEVKEVFDYIGNGSLEDIEVVSSGKDLQELIDYKRIKAKGKLKEGQIILGFLPLDLEQVTGEVGFSEGRLIFNGTLAVEGSVLGTVKSFSLDLSKRQPELWLEGTISGRAEKIQDLVANFDMFKSYQEKIKEFKTEGSLVSKIELRGPLDAFQLSFDIDSEDASLIVPFYTKFLRLKTAKIFYYKDKLNLSNLNVFNKELTIKDGGFELDLSSLDFRVKVWGVNIKPEFLEFLKDKVREVAVFFKEKGLKFENLEIEEGEFRGNLKQLAQEQVNLKQAILGNLFLKGKAVNLRIGEEVKGERFSGYSESLPLVWREGGLSFGEAAFEIEDSNFVGKGRVFDQEIFLELKGEVKERLKDKIEKVLGLKEASFLLKSPINIENLSLVYRDGQVQSRGIFKISDKEISVTLDQTKNQTTIFGSFNGKESKQKFGLRLNQNQIDLTLQGKTRLEELGTIFDKVPYPLEGLVENNLHLKFKKEKNILVSLANDYLNRNLFLEEGWLTLQGVKFKDGIAIEGEGKIAKNHTIHGKFKFEWNNSTLLADLKVDTNQKYVLVTGDLSSQKIDLKKFLGLSSTQETSDKTVKKEIWDYFQGIPLIAELKVNANDLILPTSHKLENFSLDLSLNTKAKLLWANLTKANFCGLGLDFIYSLSGEAHQFFVELLPSEGDLLDLFSCLYPEEMPTVILEGPYKVKGYVFWEGDGKDWIKNSRGELILKSKKGYIYRAPLIAHLLGFLSPIDLFRGKIPNLESQLLPYEELIFNSRFTDTTLLIDEAFLSASGFRLFGEGPINLKNKELNLTFYASPFKTIDVIIEKVPGLGKWVLGKPRMLVYLPLQVVGTYDNYNIIPLHPSSLGKGVFTFIFRLFGISEEFYQKPSPKASEIKEKKEEFLKERENINRTP